MAKTREIGYATPSGGLVGWGHLLADDDEKNPALRWPQSVDVYDQMRKEDAQVSSVLRAVTLPIRRTEWQIDGTGCRDDVTQLVAADLGLAIRGLPPRADVRRKGRFSWEDHLRLALLELVFGHAFFEQVYRIDSAGRARLAKLAYRPPKTISRIEVARDGGLVAIEQKSWGAGRTRIPVTRLVAYVNEREGAGWTGLSLLRSAYKNWLLKDRALRVQSMTLDRNGLGVPIYTGAQVPDGATPAERDDWIAAERENGLALATGLRSGATAGASLPHGAELTMRGVEGTLPDADKPIRYYDEQIARSMLAHFLNLGTETGSWALGTTFADFFTQSLQAGAIHIQSVTQQHVIEDLVDLNFGPDEPAPRLVFDAIGSKSPATADAIKALVDAGVVHPDAGLETHIRQALGLPLKETA